LRIPQGNFSIPAFSFVKKVNFYRQGMILAKFTILFLNSSLMKFTALLYAVLLSSLLTCKKNKDPEQPPMPGDVVIKDSVLVSGLAQPWEIVWGPDNFIWMTERGGKISRVDPNTGTVTPVFTVPDAAAQGEGGLLGMVLDPNFATSKQLYIAYNYNDASVYKEKIVRYTYNVTSLINPSTIYENIAAGGIHNGCRLLITTDQKLLISTGDAGNQSSPQNKNSVNGKILRLNLDKTIPSDNPIAGNPIWSWGHRNPQGLVFANGKLYSSEHGPDTDDEINIIEKGRNYGWPDVKGFCDAGEQTFCSANNVKEPIKAWTPTVAVSGLDYYNNDLIPQWKNSLLLATLKDATLHQMKLDAAGTAVTATTEYYDGKYGRLRDICIAPDGKVYICTGNGTNDKIIVVSKK
jgi:aldose sugar dehydrogenase